MRNYCDNIYFVHIYFFKKKRDQKVETNIVNLINIKNLISDGIQVWNFFSL